MFNLLSNFKCSAVLPTQQQLDDAEMRRFGNIALQVRIETASLNRSVFLSRVSSVCRCGGCECRWCFCEMLVVVPERYVWAFERRRIAMHHCHQRCRSVYLQIHQHWFVDRQSSCSTTRRGQARIVCNIRHLRRTAWWLQRSTTRQTYRRSNARAPSFFVHIVQ